MNELTIKYFVFRYPVTVNCKIIDSGKDRKIFDGELVLSGQPYNISGFAEVSGSFFTSTYLKLTPPDQSLPVIFQYKVDKKSMNEFDLHGYLQYLGKTDRFTAHLLTYEILEWKCDMEVFIVFYFKRLLLVKFRLILF